MDLLATVPHDGRVGTSLYHSTGYPPKRVPRGPTLRLLARFRHDRAM